MTVIVLSLAVIKEGITKQLWLCKFKLLEFMFPKYVVWMKEVGESYYENFVNDWWNFQSLVLALLYSEGKNTEKISLDVFLLLEHFWQKISRITRVNSFGSAFAKYIATTDFNLVALYFHWFIFNVKIRYIVKIRLINCNI